MSKFFKLQLVFAISLIILLSRCSYLRLPDILNSKVKPDSEARVACVGSDEEVKLKLTNVVHTPQITYR